MSYITNFKNTSRRIARLCLPPLLVHLWKHLVSLQGQQMANEPLYSEYQHRNAGVSASKIILRDNIILQIHPDCKIAFEYFCFRNMEMVEELNSFLALTTDCKALLDIGALHGVFSLTFTKCAPKLRSALAVDASPIAFSKLLYNIYKNPECLIIPVECAVSNKEDNLKMSYEWEHAVAGAHNTDRNSTFEAPSLKGDSLCSDKDFEPDAIKIDVEGHEIEVLEGLEDTIHKFHPMIFLEVHPTRIAVGDRCLRELLGLIKQYSFKIFRTNQVALTDHEFLSLTDDTRLILLPEIV